jgi:FAD/FMN-containing dehydrogenase
MSDLKQFLSIVESEFPGDRMTFQKSVATFHPENASEAAGFFKLAGKHGGKTYITGFGNNIDPAGEPFTEMVTVRTDRLNQLMRVVPEDFYAVAGSGFPLMELNRALKKDNLYLPHAALPYVGSVGGATAVNLTGRLGEVDVEIKKYVIKAEIVTPEGNIINPGSVCFKSVSGYDIVKIFASSWGLLGLLVSVTFRVMPISGAEDFDSFKQQPVDRGNFLAGLDESNQSSDAVYCRKIKQKFDPNGILPII